MELSNMWFLKKKKIFLIVIVVIITLFLCFQMGYFEPDFGDIPKITFYSFSTSDTKSVKPLISSRTILIDVSNNGFCLELQIVIAENDKRFQDFLTSYGSTNFIERTLGWIDIENMTGIDIYSELISTKPSIKISEAAAISWKTENINIGRIMKLTGKGRINLNIRGFKPAFGSRDTVIISIKDFKISATRPTPSNLIENKFEWRQPFGPGKTNIEIEFNHDNFFQILLNSLRLNIHEIVEYPYSLFVYFIWLLLYLLPVILVIWVLLTLQEEFVGNSEAMKNGLVTKMKRNISFILVLCLVAPTIDLIQTIDFYFFRPLYYEVQNSIEKWIKSSIGPDVVRDNFVRDFFIIICSFIFYLFLLFLQALIKNKVFKEVIKALKYASLIVLCLVILFIVILYVYHAQLLFQLISVLIGVFLIHFTILHIIKDVRVEIFDLKDLFPKNYLHFISIVASFILAYPIGKAVGLSFSLYDIVLFRQMSEIWLYIPLLALLAIFKPIPQLKLKTELKHKRLTFLAAVILAGYIVGMREWMLIPVPFLLALFLFRHLFVSPTGYEKLDRFIDTIYNNRKCLIEFVLKSRFTGKVEKASEKFDSQFLRGKIFPDKYKEYKKEYDLIIKEYKQIEALPEGIDHCAVAFATGPNKEPWENGINAAKMGFYFALAFLFIYSIFFHEKIIYIRPPYHLLPVLVGLSQFFLKYLVKAFFFGYFFQYLRGDSGLKKGLWLAGFIILCNLPLNILYLNSISDIPPLVFISFIELVFFGGLGAIAFDIKTLRNHGCNWRKVWLVNDVPAIATFISIVISTAGAAITSILTGRIAEMIKLILGTAIPEIKDSIPK
jgi:hypothetical protein